jgi:OmpA-OmpF porin, OOP family
MKKTVYLVLCFIMTYVSKGQQTNYTQTPAMGVHVSFFDIAGADSLRSFGRNMKAGLAIHYQNNISKQFDYAITLAGTYLDFPDRKNNSLGNGKKQLLLETDASIRAKLFAPGTLFNPYAQGGVGVSAYNNYYGIFIPTGLGCQVNLTPDLFILFNSQYRIPVTNTQHRHFYHSIGLAGTISKKKINKRKPVASPPPVVMAKPVDSDGDGIVDSADRCPFVVGVMRYQGCPPPDRDGDHINDEEDECPDVKGVARYKGCPEPDTDRDGIADFQDKCPGIAGTAVNNGCPEITNDLKSKINAAAKHVFFKTGSYTLLPSSFPALDEVVRILQNNPAIQLLIEGHTDNTGTP